jgi:hypothetical protein
MTCLNNGEFCRRKGLLIYWTGKMEQTQILIGIAFGFKKCSYSISKGQIKTAPSRQITSFKSCTKLN